MINFGEVLINVLAIIGIIVAGGFLIFFLGDLLLSVLDPANSALKGKKDSYPQQTYFPEHTKEQLQQPEKTEALPYNTQQKFVDVDYAKALEEERLLKQAFENADKNLSAQVEPQPEKENDIFAQLRAEEEAFKREKFEAALKTKQAAMAKASESKFDEDEFNFDDIFFDDDFEDEDEEEVEIEEKPKEEKITLQEPQVQEQEEKVEKFSFAELPKNENLEDIERELDQKTKENEILRLELEEKIKELESIRIKSKEEKEKIALENAKNLEEKEKLEKERDSLLEMLKQVKEHQSIVNPEGANLMTLADYEQRLETLKERLKYNEKELRAIKKEYLPLMKVRKNLEADKKKLRAKEALVAKQKVMLYGVNKIVDIDEKKAKKLAEDLDLLDGLRLSVQHCEEVIKNSAERYPILETSYRILTTSIKEIKSDIARVEEQIRLLKNENKDN